MELESVMESLPIEPQYSCNLKITILVLCFVTYVVYGQMQNIYCSIVQELKYINQVINIGTLTVVTHTVHAIQGGHQAATSQFTTKQLYSSGIKHRFQSWDLNRKVVRQINAVH